MMEDEKGGRIDFGEGKGYQEDPEKQPPPERHADASDSGPASNAVSSNNLPEQRSGYSPRVKYGFAAVATAALIGLFVGLAQLKTEEIPTIPSTQEIQLKRLSYFDESVLRGYPDEGEEGSGCQNFKEDLYEAVEIMTNVTIDRQAIQRFHNNLWPWCPVARGNADIACADVVMDMTESDGEVAESAPVSDNARETSPTDAESGGEDSYGTNNQVEGVDEADKVKSDGTHVFAAYGSQLIVWDAITGDRLSTTDIPTVDDDGYDICTQTKGPNGYETLKFPCYQHYSWYGGSPIKISSLLIHDDRLLIIADASSLYLTEEEYYQPQKALDNKGNTRLFIYDIDPSNIPNDNTDLTLVARKDINGRYQTGRKIGQHAHIVTSSSLNSWYHIDSKISAWNEDFVDMDEDEYRAEAYTMSLDLGRKFVDDLFEDLSVIYSEDDDACAKIAKVALMMKSKRSNNNSTSHRLPSFTTSVILQTFTQVYSIDLLQDLLIDDTPKSTLDYSASGAFFPTASYTSNVYASADKLFIAGESYIEDDDGEWNENTVFLVYDFKNNGTEASAIGGVPGSLLNQFSMDHFSDTDNEEDYLRVATTSWARWGFDESGAWQQTDESQSSVFVLKLGNNEEDGGVMEEVGSASGIGMGERIYAVRFLGDKGYIVTFRQIDPFYTLDLSDHTNPSVVGELKINGYSNYLQPVNEDLILGLGQDADDQGRVIGLQISLFDVSNFESPIRLRQYVERGGSSAAQYEHKAFRYLPESKLLILPVSTNWWEDDVEYFDGFVVYDVDETKDFEKKFSISHVNGREAGGYCWSQNTLPSRSLVFNGDVTTLRGHKVYSHDLETEEYLWDINLDENRDEKNSNRCYGWAWE